MITVIKNEELIAYNRRSFTKVIASFPGTGKNQFVREYSKFNNQNIKIKYLNWNNFSKNKDGSPNFEYPNNYIQEIKNNIGVVDVLFITSQSNIRKILSDDRIDVTLYYPAEQLYSNYIELYNDRHYNHYFIKMMIAQYYQFIKAINDEELPHITYKKINDPKHKLVDLIKLNLIDEFTDPKRLSDRKVLLTTIDYTKNML